MSHHRSCPVQLLIALSIFIGLGTFWSIVFLLIIFHEGASVLEYASTRSSANQGIVIVTGLIASGLLGLATALAVERAKKPRLAIFITGPNEHEFDNKKLRSVHLQISHQGAAFFDSFLLSPPALTCVVRFRIIREDGSDAFPSPFDARWTGSQQPTEFRVADGGIYPSVFEMLKRRDIFPHTSEQIDLCIKFEGDNECFVFNNSSYVKGYRHKELQLPQGVYLIEVSASSGDITVSKRVRLRNDLPRSEFRIEPI